MKTLFKGFSFGLVLQVAVGPLFVYIVTTALTNGFWSAFGGVVAVTLADALFVTLAILGIGSFIKGAKMQKTLKRIGGIVIVVFGLAVFLSGFGIILIPSFNLASTTTSGSVFITALVLTLSSPLTLVFWAGVFGTRVEKNDGNLKQTAIYGLGAVLSTLCFLTLASAVAGTFTNLMTPRAIRLLNLAAGLVLVVFGVLMLTKKSENS